MGRTSRYPPIPMPPDAATAPTSSIFSDEISSFDHGATRAQRSQSNGQGPSAPPSTIRYSSAQESLNTYNEKVRGYTDWERDELMPSLANRSYHIPGQGCCADWFQYFANTHPLFGMCCHHRLHPVKCPMRLLNLVGSFVFGLLVTNMIWLFLVYDETLEANRAIVTISVGTMNNGTDWRDSVADEEDPETGTATIQVTEGMIVLWTIGGFMHAVYDTALWYSSACACCLPGRAMHALSGLKRYCFILLAFFIVLIAAMSSLLVVVRATLTDHPDQELPRSAGLLDDEIEPLTGFEDKSSFQFLLSYSVEVFVALIVWYPVLGTILFSGILGCGRIPVLGGRPYEIMQEKKRLERLERRRQKKQRKQQPKV